MTLQSWRLNSWLVQHVTSAQEIADLWRIADRDLAASQVKGLPADWRLAIAYNSALQSATAALAAAAIVHRGTIITTASFKRSNSQSRRIESSFIRWMVFGKSAT